MNWRHHHRPCPVFVVPAVLIVVLCLCCHSKCTGMPKPEIWKKHRRIMFLTVLNAAVALTNVPVIFPWCNTSAMLKKKSSMSRRSVKNLRLLVNVMNFARNVWKKLKRKKLQPHVHAKQNWPGKKLWQKIKPKTIKMIKIMILKKIKHRAKMI